MQIEGKRIVITGAATGLGRELLRQLAYYDAEIIAADKDAERLGEAVREPENARASLNPFVCDLATRSGTDELIAHALATLSGIDIFVAITGRGTSTRLDNPTWDDVAVSFAVNAVFPIYTTFKMAELNPENPYLTVVCATEAVYQPSADNALYYAGRGGVHFFADVYRRDLPVNGRLLVVYPDASPNLPALCATVIRGIQSDATTVVYPSWVWRVSNFVQQLFLPAWSAARRD